MSYSRYSDSHDDMSPENETQNKTLEDKSLEDDRYISWLKAQRKFPNKKHYEQYLQESKSAKSVIVAPDKTITVFESEAKAINVRRKWQTVLHEVNEMNKKKNEKENNKEVILKRIRNFINSEIYVEKIYNAAMTFLREHSVIVMTFNARLLKETLISYQALSLADDGNVNRYSDDYRSTYRGTRNDVEKQLYRNLSDGLKSDFFSIPEMRPKYAALLLLDRYQHIQAVEAYGKSFIVMHNKLKLNSLFMDADSFMTYQTNELCTYSNLELLLAQCSHQKFSAIMQRITTGYLPIETNSQKGYSQQYDMNHVGLGYIEVSIPAIDLLDPNLVQHIHFNTSEGNPDNELIDLLTSKGITITKGYESPYPTLYVQLMGAIKSCQLFDVKNLLERYPTLIQITDQNGLSPFSSASAEVKEILNKAGFREPAVTIIKIPEKSLAKLLANDDVAYMRSTLELFPDLIKYTDSYDNSLLHLLISKENLNQLKEFVGVFKNKFDINVYNRKGVSPLMTAIWLNCAPAVEILLNAFPNEIDFNGNMPGGHHALTNAMEKDVSTEILILLLNYPTAKNFINKKRNVDSLCPLYIAGMTEQHAKVAALVIFSDISLNRNPKDYRGNPLSSSACEWTQNYLKKIDERLVAILALEAKDDLERNAVYTLSNPASTEYKVKDIFTAYDNFIKIRDFRTSLDNYKISNADSNTQIKSAYDNLLRDPQEIFEQIYKSLQKRKNHSQNYISFFNSYKKLDNKRNFNDPSSSNIINNANVNKRYR